MATLTHAETARYSRHLLLPEVGMQGQQALKDKSVLLVGTGGLGSPAALYLAAAGVGRLGLVDYDIVDVSNLQRQIIHGDSTVGQRKVDSAKKRLADINPHVTVETYDTQLSSQNALEICRTYDVIADGTDNFPTRYLVNDACVLLKKPNVYASIFRFEGQLSVFDAQKGPCYRCLYPEPPPPGLVPSCAEGGVLGVLPGTLGMLQATEVIKVLLNLGDTMVGRLLLFDALEMRFRELKLRRDPKCAMCSEHATIKHLIDYEQFCGMPAHDRQQKGNTMNDTDITPKDLQKLRAEKKLRLIDVREPHEWEIGRIDGAELIPLGDLPGRAEELNRDDDIVVYCKMGGRSAKGVEVLRQLGFKKLRNLQGGINAWSRDVDPSVPLY